MDKQKNKVLIVVDAQYDFINGSLAVNGAESKMLMLADYIYEHGKEYEAIILTADWHPINHKSFKVNGGIWPTHCVQHTVGASIFQPIVEASFNTVRTFVATKGDIPTVEEYSVMDNYFSQGKILKEVSDKNITQIDICGIANEYCVKETVKSLTEKHGLGDKITILSNFVAAIEKDELSEYAREKGLKVV